MQKAFLDWTKVKPFRDKKTGVRIAYQRNGFLRIDNIKVAKFGVRTYWTGELPVECRTDETNKHNTVDVFCLADDVFKASCMRELVCVPILRSSLGGWLQEGTARDYFPSEDKFQTPAYHHTHPIGCYTDFKAKDNCLFCSAIIWGVHAFAYGLLHGKSAFCLTWGCRYKHLPKARRKKYGDCEYLQYGHEPNSGFMAYDERSYSNKLFTTPECEKWCYDNIVKPYTTHEMRHQHLSDGDLGRLVYGNDGKGILKRNQAFFYKTLSEMKADKKCKYNFPGDCAYVDSVSDPKRRCVRKNVRFFWNGKEWVDESRLEMYQFFHEEPKKPSAEPVSPSPECSPSSEVAKNEKKSKVKWVGDRKMKKLQKAKVTKSKKTPFSLPPVQFPNEMKKK